MGGNVRARDRWFKFFTSSEWGEPLFGSVANLRQSSSLLLLLLSPLDIRRYFLPFFGKPKGRQIIVLFLASPARLALFVPLPPPKHTLV